MWAVERMRPLAGPSKFCPEDFQGFLEVLWLPDQGPVIQEPQVAGQGGDSLGDEVDQWLEDEGEEQGGQGVPLV